MVSRMTTRVQRLAVLSALLFSASLLLIHRPTRYMVLDEYDEHVSPRLKALQDRLGLSAIPPPPRTTPEAYDLARLDRMDTSLLWGTYRPNLYFGIRPRVPEPYAVLHGLLWFGFDEEGNIRARHSCVQDEISGMVWLYHDGRTGGKQHLDDVDHNALIKTDFVKMPEGGRGGSWSVRYTVEPKDPNLPMRIHLIPYVVTGSRGSLRVLNTPDRKTNTIPGPIRISGRTPALGDFRIKIEEDTEGADAERIPAAFGYRGLILEDDHLWRAQDLLFRDARFGQLSGRNSTGSNFFAFEIEAKTRTSINVHYSSAEEETSLSGSSLINRLRTTEKTFRRRFEETFQLAARNFTENEIVFARRALANLMGGIGYFYGRSLVDRAFSFDYDDIASISKAHAGSPQWTEPKELFTGTPSRSVFARGFYWDEGFHLLLVGEWDSDLSLEILSSWISLIDEKGWVAREQILGEEARSTVPDGFQIQYPQYANPPTLIMAVNAYLRRLRQREYSPSEDGSDRRVEELRAAKAYLTYVYPALLRHYHWFRMTQRGQYIKWNVETSQNSVGFRWRGRTEEEILASGMDDYPRTKFPDKRELHVDLLCWMAFFTRSMQELAIFVGETEDASQLGRRYGQMVNDLDSLHWSSLKQVYCDVGVTNRGAVNHACAIGYVAIMPFLLRLLPADSPQLGPLLQWTSEGGKLWSPYGLRSLAKNDVAFGTGDNYWRGPVWINMNYLALQALWHYMNLPGPYQEQTAQMYLGLRRNILKNVYAVYRATGHFYEQYDGVTGEGLRAHPFNGWTSLVTLIMAEIY